MLNSPSRQLNVTLLPCWLNLNILVPLSTNMFGKSIDTANRIESICLFDVTIRCYESHTSTPENMPNPEASGQIDVCADQWRRSRWAAWNGRG